MRRVRRPALAKAALRRPAAEAPVREARGSAADRWSRGEELLSTEFAPGLFGSGSWLKSTQATYFEAPCEFAGKVDKVVLEDNGAELVLTLTGTSTEELLKYASGIHPPVIRAHLCGAGCDQKRSNQDLVHLSRFKQVVGDQPKTWEENLKEDDVNRELRRKQEEWERRQERPGQEGEERSVSRAREDKKKKIEKTKAKKKERRERLKKIGGKAVAKKHPQDLFGGTGLDPDAKIRRRVKKKAKRKLKKSKTSSSSSSQSSSSSSSVDGSRGLLEDRNKVQRLAEVAPGVLTEESLQYMKGYVLQASGSTWAMDTEALPPIASQYVRSFIAPRSSGGILREAVSLAHCLDLLLLGRAAECADALNQRLKSLELTIAGQPWATSQKIEVVPQLEASMASRAELQVAQKEARLDGQTKGQTASWEKGKGKTKTKDKDKGREKGKGGKNKEEGKKSS